MASDDVLKLYLTQGMKKAIPDGSGSQLCGNWGSDAFETYFCVLDRLQFRILLIRIDYISHDMKGTRNRGRKSAIVLILI